MKKAAVILIIFNCILICVAWLMVLYTYSRLPQRIPIWLDFFGQQHVFMKKSPLFFLYILTQTLFCAFFFLLAQIMASRMKESWKAGIFKEYMFLTLIFINLIFIHIQRSIILVARQIEGSVDRFYFYSLFGIILILIPYYRLRIKLAKKRQELDRLLKNPTP